MRYLTGDIAVIVAAALSIVIPLFSQNAPHKPAFEVASIKSNTSGDNRVSLDATKGRFAATNTSLRILVRYAFDRRLPEDEMRRALFLFSSTSALQVIGGPSWISNDRFDIEAKPTHDHPVAQAEMQLMLRSLLEDRFQLRVHREMREVPTYNLVVVKEGKIKESSDDNPPPSITPQGEKLVPLPRGRLSTFVIGAPKPPLLMTMYGNAVRISELIPALESWAGRPVNDRTNLKGPFHVLLQFSPQQASTSVQSPDAPQGAPPDPTGPSIFTAIQQELGLKLESARGSVEVLVIDSISKPSEN